MQGLSSDSNRDTNAFLSVNKDSLSNSFQKLLIVSNSLTLFFFFSRSTGTYQSPWSSQLWCSTGTLIFFSCVIYSTGLIVWSKSQLGSKMSVRWEDGEESNISCLFQRVSPSFNSSPVQSEECNRLLAILNVQKCWLLPSATLMFIICLLLQCT